MRRSFHGGAASATDVTINGLRVVASRGCPQSRPKTIDTYSFEDMDEQPDSTPSVSRTPTPPSVEASLPISIFDDRAADADRLQRQVAQLLEQDQRKNEFLA